jgi:putative aldouronate transport system permease protein
MLKTQRTIDLLKFDAWNYLFLAFLGLITFYPFYYMIVASLSGGNALIAHDGLLLWPVSPTLVAYEKVASNPKIARGFLNSIYVVVAGVGINMAITSLTAYALSRKHLVGRSFLLKFAVFTMIFDRGLIPLFLLVRNVGLYGSLWSVILTFAVNTYNLLIMVTFFRGVPESLE